MLVGFVNAGLVTLEQAVGVIFGANIGTTVTAWIVALVGFDFDLKTFAIPIFGLGYLLTLVKKLKKESLGIAIMGFGMLFIGLGWLSSTFKADDGSTIPELIEIVGALDDFGAFSVALGVVSGVLFTALIHSSSAMTAIVITIAAAEPSFWRVGAALVIGSTMGSTIDSIMAAIGGKPNAKRTALIHVLFNCSASLLALALFNPFLSLIELIIPGDITERNISYHIALLNTAFKLLATLVFIPFVDQIAALTRVIISDRDGKEENRTYRFEFNEKTAREMPETCVIQAQKEIADFADILVEMFDTLQSLIKGFGRDGTLTGYDRIERLEDYTDQMHVQLAHYLIRCTALNISGESMENVSHMLQIAEELESMADGCLSIATQLKKAVDKEMRFREEDLDRLLPYFELSRQFLQFIYKNVAKIQLLSKEQFEFAEELEAQIDAERKSLKKVARKRLESGADVKAELLYLDIVRQIEKLGDRCFDVAETMGR